MRLVIAAFAATLLCGCASQRIYNWGGYDDALYASYKDPAKTEDLRAKLQAHIEAMETSKQKVAPGLYAELGTLYLQSGAKPTAVALYRKERDAWPESAHLMNSLISRLERDGIPRGEKN